VAALGAKDSGESGRAASSGFIPILASLPGPGSSDNGAFRLQIQRLELPRIAGAIRGEGRLTKSRCVPKSEQWAANRPPSPERTPVILFLDFDGVLHPDPCYDASRLFENAPRLAHALRDFPRVTLVLSTSWRQARPYEQLLGLLPAPLRQRVIGITPNFADFTPSAGLVPYRRQAECVRWMQQNQMQDDAWLALDDRPNWFSPYCENLIACDPQTGFDATERARLRSALQRHFQRQASAVDLPIG
jgi:hypothetical protein